MQAETFIFFGIIGSGKGTQVKYLKDFLKKRDGRECIIASTGGEYRKFIENGSYVGALIKNSITQGELQPNFLTDAIFTNILISSLSPEKHLIADGYPRTVAQSETFDAMMKFFKRENIRIIYLEIGEEEAMKRNLLRARDDDTEEGIKNRFKEYKNNVIPAMNYFKNKEGYEIFKINGEQSKENVYKDMIKTLF